MDYGENDCDKILLIGAGNVYGKGVRFRDCVAGEALRHGRHGSWHSSLLWRGLQQVTWKTNLSLI